MRHSRTIRNACGTFRSSIFLDPFLFEEFLSVDRLIIPMLIIAINHRNQFLQNRMVNMTKAALILLTKMTNNKLRHSNEIWVPERVKFVDDRNKDADDVWNRLIYFSVPLPLLIQTKSIRQWCIVFIHVRAIRQVLIPDLI